MRQADRGIYLGASPAEAGRQRRWVRYSMFLVRYLFHPDFCRDAFVPTMVSFPPCKINLGLHILRKRPDGYHDLETCFLPVPWTDMLEIIPSSAFAFSPSGLDIPGDASDNLCVRAYQLLQKDFSLPPVQIHLHKIIPTGAGLGGGSADAAYTLRLLNDIFNLNLSQSSLATYAARLGSDCAFFTQDQPMIGTGRGEILEAVDLSLAGKYLVICKPDTHISTAEAYAAITPQVPAVSIREIVTTRPLEEWWFHLRNDFESPIMAKHPVIKNTKDKFYIQGARYASMSGSGAAVFAIFDQDVEIDPEAYEGVLWKGRL
jgi:4-diphosphocytidyl-2-C-methyl-D-erythritol kinase